MTKQDFMRLVESLPEDTPFEQLAAELEKIRFKAEINASIAELNRGEGIPHEEVEHRLAKWLED